MGLNNLDFGLDFTVIQILDLKKLTHWGMIPGEINSLGYHTPGSHVLVDFY